MNATRDDLWTSAVLRKLAKLRRQGKTTAEIADEISRPRGSVEAKIHQLLQDGTLPFLSRDEKSRRTDPSRARRSARLEQRAESALAAAIRADCPDFGYVVGVLLGDGFIERTYRSMGLKTTEDSFARSFATAVKKSLGFVASYQPYVEPLKEIGGYSYRNTQYFHVYVHARHLARRLSEMFGSTSTKAKAWRINVARFRAIGDRFSRGVLQGLFDSDGSASLQGGRLQISISSTNAVGLRQAHRLLSKLGVPNGFSGPSKKGEYRIRIGSRAGVWEFARTIGSRHAKKSARLKAFLRQHRVKPPRHDLHWHGR